MTNKEKAEAYVRQALPELKGFDVGGFGVLDETPHLQHWLRVSEKLEGKTDCVFHPDGTLHIWKNYQDLADGGISNYITFNLTTGQPASESDYQALCNIFGI